MKRWTDQIYGWRFGWVDGWMHERNYEIINGWKDK